MLEILGYICAGLAIVPVVTIVVVVFVDFIINTFGGDNKKGC